MHTAKPDPLHDKSAKPRKSQVFAASDFIVAEDQSHATCPAGQRLYRNGKDCTVGDYRAVKFRAPIGACSGFELRGQCLLKEPRHHPRSPGRRADAQAARQPQ